MKYDYIGVREFAELMTRSGGIKAGSGGNVPLHKARKGVRLHKAVQKNLAALHEDFVSERQVVFSPENIDGQGKFTLEGRVDGIYREDGTVVVVEIKSCDRHPEEAEMAHWLQGAMYGFILSREQDPEECKCVRIEVLYGLYSDFNDIKKFDFCYSAGEIEEAVRPYFDDYSKFVRDMNIHSEKLHKQLSELKFIHGDFREGQRKMAVNIYNALTDPTIPMILCQAPTGIGKTAGTVFPALKALPHNAGDKSAIFYLTARNEGSRPPEETLSLAAETAPELRFITLTSKEKICIFRSDCAKSGADNIFECDPANCPYATNHYDNIAAAIDDLLGSNNIFNRGNICDTARRFSVCPFELSLDISVYCDVIIGDYNYLFDPESYLKRFFSASGGQYYYLIDEAHQLPDRVRAMYSASLSANRFEKAAKGKKRRNIGKSLVKISEIIDGLTERQAERRTEMQTESFSSDDSVDEGAPDSVPEILTDELERMCDLAFEYLENNPDRELLQLCFDVLHFNEIASMMKDGGFALRPGGTGWEEKSREGSKEISKEKSKAPDRVYDIICLDPSGIIRNKCGTGLGSVLFSATLLPEEYYKNRLGAADMPYIFFESPFPRENLLSLAGTFTDTRYRAREASYPQVASFITNLGKSLKTGNYACFFGSWTFLRNVYDRMDNDFREKYIFIQPESSDINERNVFINGFVSRPESLHIGFCVLGGAFSEGVDLCGDRLSGAVIVGTGVPQVNYSNELLRSYYEKSYYENEQTHSQTHTHSLSHSLSHSHSGYDYAYFYPGANKVIQAAGRVIRTPADRGFVALIDIRYGRSDHKKVFADAIDYKVISDPEKLISEIVEFSGRI